MSERLQEADATSEQEERELHAVMACGLVPIMMLPLSWWLTARRVWGQGAAKASSLSRRLLAITIFDTVLAIALATVVLARGMPEAPPPGPPRIGIQVADAETIPGARVASVWQDSPAQRAGLHKDDVIHRIDDTDIDGWERLNAELRTQPSGNVRRLRVRRGHTDLTIDVTPLSGLASEPTPRPLFDPDPSRECGAAWVESLPATLWPVGFACLLLSGIALWGRRKKHRTRWLWVLLPMIAAPVAGIATAHGACVQTGGWSVGTALVGLLGQGVTMLALGWVVLRMLRGELDARMGPQLSTVRAARLAVLYIASAMARAGIALFVLMTLVPALQEAQDPAVNALLQGSTGPAGRAMMVTAAVVLAPLSEEVIFRGILLPGLSRHMHTQRALIVSAVLFGLFHVPSHGVGAILPGLLGLVFGWARLRTGSLAAPILLHAANNLLVTLLAWGV